MELKFPSFSEYQSALQNPQVCFKHYPLQGGKIEKDLWGLPRVRSGGFALTYKLSGHDRKLAVRCFYRSIPDRMQRYFAISQFIDSCGSAALIPVRYLSRGIQVQGKSYPVTYMEWVDGATMDEWLVKNYARKKKMLALAEEFLRLVRELDALGIAHGDLSHRNILYNGKKAVLIDYDGMYVPSMKGKLACELGNPYFQHPGRKREFFNPRIDRFSEIAIYLALSAIALQPELYRRFETGGEGLLFTKKDFLHPYHSAALMEIEKLTDLRGMVQNFRAVCLGAVEEIPSLDEFLKIDGSEQLRSESDSRLDEEDEDLRPVFESGERKDILRHEGEIIQVVGMVTEVFWGKRIEGQPHVFINFGSWRKKCFTIVLWDEPLQDFTAGGMDPNGLEGKWVSVTGLQASYNNRPQITLATLSEMMVLDGPREASELLGRLVGEEEDNGQEAGRPCPDSTYIPGGWVQAKLPAVDEERGGNHEGGLDRSNEVVDRIDQLYRK